MPAFTNVSMNISATVLAMFLTSPSKIGSLKHKPWLDRHVCPAPSMLVGSKQAQVGFEGRLGGPRRTALCGPPRKRDVPDPVQTRGGQPTIGPSSASPY